MKILSVKSIEKEDYNQTKLLKSPKKINLEHINRTLSKINELLSPLMNEEFREIATEIELSKAKINDKKRKLKKEFKEISTLDETIKIQKKKISLLGKLGRLLGAAKFNVETLNRFQQIIKSIEDSNISLNKLETIDKLIKSIKL